MKTDLLLEVTAVYKMGHQRLSVRASVRIHSIARIEEIPQEMPEYADGMNSRVHLITGEMMFVTNLYEDLVRTWGTLLKDSEA